jgi:hypothetical protein
MKRIIPIVCFAFVSLIFNSCNKNLDKVLFGTWTVTSVEGTLNVGGNSVFNSEDANPTGTVKFNSNGTGEQNYSFTFAGTVYNQVDDFSWEANNDEIIINRVSDPDMIWSRIFDSESKQIASYNIVVDAQQNWDYTLTLEK